MEKCGLVASATSSYQEAEDTLYLMTGLKVGHSSLHRLVQRYDLPELEVAEPVTALSVDGGNVRLRTAEPGPCQWRNYKAVCLHELGCAAYFQDNDALIAWVKGQPLAPVVTCVGDGHDGVWNIMAQLTPAHQRQEVLDWYHLVENLYKLGESPAYLRRLKGWLWSGKVEQVLAELQGLRSHASERLRAYLTKHRHRIVYYALHQKMGYAIGSGAVESTIKRIGARLKLSGAQWLPSSVPQMLRLRCAYLNGAFSLGIYA